ncbi:AUGMIN subunit 7-like isoform X2 [Populus alba]|uniref:AUGMIN subunit 7-like isoform X2 n=1 Tax=Populus alba TaxID=43335 RepID=UPI003CC77A60
MIWHLSMHAIQTRSMLRWNRTQAHLESFLEIARSFNAIYTKEIRPWTHMMEVPQLHGFGLAANRLLEAYKMLWKAYHINQRND